MEEILQHKADRRDDGREDLLRAAFKFLSITMLSVFLALFVVQVGLSQPDRTDRTLEQLKELKRLTHPQARAW